jgi:outer membrane protein OmpA-like peptidoglycan-associated protein
MKKFTRLLSLIALITTNIFFGQDQELSITKNDSLVNSSWMIGLGYNFVNDSGDLTDGAFDFKNNWNGLAYPNRLSVGKYFKNGLGVEAIGTVNKYKVGKTIDRVINDVDKTYLAVDVRLNYDLNKLIGHTSWFDPYVGVGLGYTDANNIGRGTYNANIGFRTWFNDRFALDLNSTGKWSMKKLSNHIQHSASVIYQFDVEKDLSKKGKEKLALIEAIQKEKERVNDSIDVARQKEAAAVLAQRLEQEKENARLAAIEKEKVDAAIARKQDIRNRIDALGFAYFELNSSVINRKSKTVLDSLAEFLSKNPSLQLKVDSHTDSRSDSNYNMWLSERRVEKTMNYLLSKGVNPSQLTSEAFGEEKLLNDCDDSTPCTEDKHSVNRRSEFIIMKF